MSNGVLNFNFVKDGSVIEFNQESVSYRPLSGVMIVNAEALVFNTIDLGPQCIDARVSS